MTYLATNPNPLWYGRWSRQSQSQQSPQSHQDNYTNTSPSNNKKHILSAPMPHGVSFNLVSLVTKFEALDALSLPITIPSLQPAPLRISRNSSRQKDAIGISYKRKLSTIFSPRRGSMERCDTGISEDELMRAQADILSSSNPKLPSTLDKKIDKRKLRKSQTSYKPSNIRLRGGVWDPAETVRGKGIGAGAAPYFHNGILEEKKGGSIRDKIKFFDGTVSTGTNTRAKPSASNTVTTNTPFSLSRNRTSDKSRLLNPSTASSRRNVRNPDVEALTPTRPNQSAATRHTVGLTPSRMFAQSSLSKSLSNISPRTMESLRQYGKGQDTSPSIIAVRSRALESSRKRRSAICETTYSTPLGGDGSPASAAELHDDNSWLSNRRRLSDKISQLYSAKSLERKNEAAQDTADEQGLVRTSLAKANRDIGHGQRIVSSWPTKMPEKRHSKVAAIRKLFDSNFASKCPPSEEHLHASVPVFPEVSPFHQEHTTLLGVAVVTPPTPPLIPPSKYSTDSPPSPKSLQESPSSMIQSILDAHETLYSQPSSPVKKLSPPKSRLIGDRVKIFEKAENSTDLIVDSRRRSMFRRKLSKSLRSLFEPPSRKSQEEAEVEKANLPIGNPAWQHRAHPPDGRVGKRNHVVGRWNTIPTGPLSSGGDGTMSEKESSSVEEEVVEMVVKGVECGLKQPRPVRAVEMKRMALICRDRVGDILDREKGRAGQRRQL